MPRKLSDESLGEPISPLIDVVMNGFAAMFIILIIFISVFHQRDETPTPKFLEIEPPPLIRGQHYAFTLPVIDGIGPRRFGIVKGDIAAFGLSLDPNTGTIFGLADVATKETSLSFPLTSDCEFEVVDAAGRRDSRPAKLIMSSGAVPFPDTPIAIDRQEGILPGGRLGDAYETVLGASGGVEPYSWKLLSGKLPDGVSLDSERGRLIGQPKETGTFSFEIGVEHLPGTFVANGVRYDWSGGKSASRYEMVVCDAFKASLNLPTGRVGESYAGSMNSNGRLPDERLSWTAQVPGLSFSDNDGSVSGVPQQAGVFDVSYRVSGVPDGRGVGEQRLQILPAVPSKEVGAVTIQCWVGSQTDVLLPYRGMKEPVNITNLEPLPAGLVIDGARLKGTPTQAGSATVPIAIRDISGGTTNGTVTIYVHPDRQPMVLNEQVIVPLVVGMPVIWRPPTAGGEGRISWSIDGPLPAGLVLSNGVLVGTIQARGVWPGKITVRDDVAGSLVTQNIEFRGLLPEETPIRIATTAIPPAFVGNPFDFVFAAEGGVGAPRYFVTGDLPPGLSFKTNRIQGNPQAAGDWQITVAVEDTVGQRDTPRQFAISVKHGDQSQPELLTTNIPPALIGVPYEFVFSVGGGVGMPTFSFSGELPMGLRFAGNGISGIAQKIQDTSVEVSAIDEAARRTPPRRFTLRSVPNDMTKPEVVTTSLHPAVRGEAYVHELAAEGGIGRYHWSVSGDLPTGLRLAAHGIGGVVDPNAHLGDWNLRVTVSDDVNNISDEKTLPLRVVDPNSIRRRPQSN